MEVIKVHEDIYRLRNVFTENDILSICDEFSSYTPSVDKKEMTEFPGYFQALKKTGDHLGDNMGLIKLSPKINMITRKLLKPEFNTTVSRINTNIMHPGQQSDFHVDGYTEWNFNRVGSWKTSPKLWTWTFLVFCSDYWSTKWDGEFCCQLSDGEYVYIPYIPGECVLFNGWLSHKGCGPNNFAEEARHTVAWTLTGNLI